MRLHRFALFWGILCLGLLSVLTLLYTAARVSDVVLVPFVRAELVAGGGGRAAGNGLAVVQVMAPHSGLLIRRLNSSTHDSSAATPTFSSVDHSQQHTPGELDVDLDLAELRDGRVHVTDDYESIPTPPPANLSSQLLNLLSDRWHSSLLSEGKSSILHEFLEGSHNREMAHLRQMFPLAPNFTLPNPQVWSLSNTVYGTHCN